MKVAKGLEILWQRFTRQGVRVTMWWAADHAARILTGAPIRRVSQITPGLHVGGQYRRQGWPTLESRGITAVVNLRAEFDDAEAGIAPEGYLYLPTEDDRAPTMEALRRGVSFIAEEVEEGGAVYVHCGSGIGRAATMAAAYLIDSGLNADEAWAWIRKARPFIRPTPPQLQQIENYAGRADDG
jgi:protein tyrosine phosphatase (PTP) superfamily phosphohydrolase (DUF442 family)